MNLFNRFKLLSEKSLQKSSQHFNFGQRYLKEKHYKEALECFIQALHDYPDQPPILNMIGVTLSQLGDYKRAETYYQKSTQIDPNYSIGYYNLAICQFNQALYPQSLQSIQTAQNLIAKTGDTSIAERILLAEGNILLKLNRSEEARHRLENYLQAHPSLPIRIQLATISLAQHDYEDVIDLLEPYLEELNVAQDLNILLQAYQALHHSEGEIKTYKQLFFQFHDASAGWKIVQRCLDQGDYPKSQAMVKLIRERDEGYSSWNEEYAIMLHQTGYSEQALEEADHLMDVYLEQDEISQAERIRDLVLQWQPDHLNAHYRLIDYYQRHQSYLSAATEYEHLLAKHNSEVKPYLDYIKILEKLTAENRSYLDKIQHTWENLASHFPNDPNVTLGLGKNYALFMKYQEAIQFIEMAIQQKPDLWEGYYELGLLYLAIGNPNRAFSYLSTVRNRRKEFPNIEEIIKQIRIILKKDL